MNKGARVKAGWQTKKLGDFSKAISTGLFGSLLHKSDYVGDGVPLVNPTNIVNDRILPDPSMLIGETTRQRLGNYLLKEGDIVVGRRGEIGRCAVVGPTEAGWLCGTGSFFIRPLPSIDSRFLAHLIRSNTYRGKLEEAATGTTMKNLSSTALSDLVVSIPNLLEQQRIVAILDEAFDDIATAKANADGDHLPPPKAAAGVPFITIGNIDKETRKIDFTNTFMVTHGYFNGLKVNRKPKRGDVPYTVTGSLGIPVIVEDDAKFCFQRWIGKSCHPC